MSDDEMVALAITELIDIAQERGAIIRDLLDRVAELELRLSIHEQARRRREIMQPEAQ